MWLPQSAEVYSDWRGRRFHRRHTFSKYLLFTVDDQQHISAPKTGGEIPLEASSEAVSHASIRPTRPADWFLNESAWSVGEKETAKRAFDRAYQRKCAEVEAQVRKMLASLSSPSDLWQVNDYLSEQRKAMDAMFDYRYSVLMSVFGHLLREGWLKEADLAGLQEDKIEEIKRQASL
jgi:hypothetical protein